MLVSDLIVSDRVVQCVATLVYLYNKFMIIGVAVLKLMWVDKILKWAPLLRILAFLFFNPSDLKKKKKVVFYMEFI